MTTDKSEIDEIISTYIVCPDRGILSSSYREEAITRFLALIKAEKRKAVEEALEKQVCPSCLHRGSKVCANQCPIDQHAKEVAIEAVKRVVLKEKEDYEIGSDYVGYNIAIDDLEDVKQKVIEEL